VAHIMRYRYPDGLSEPVIATIMKEVRRQDSTAATVPYCTVKSDVATAFPSSTVLLCGFPASSCSSWHGHS
jgi:hypothetical protein